MSLTAKKGRDSSQLPTLSYEVKLNLPANLDSHPQEISFLDLIANDSKFKNDKESLELVLSSYVKACGKESVKEILAERDTIIEDNNASLSDVIHALMDYNDQQNANLGVGYDDPDDDDSFIDDSKAAQDIIPRNMTNERDGFYVNEKHQPINARYLSDPSESESDDDSDDDEESSESGSEKEDKQAKRPVQNEADVNEKNTKKSKTDDDLTPTTLNAKRKRSISEVGAPPLPSNVDEKDKAIKPVEETVKKVKKLSENSNEHSSQNAISYILPNEMDTDVRPSLEKLIKLIVLDQVQTDMQKKVERLFESNVCRQLLDLVNKLHRHTNAHRQLVFDILSSKTGICATILVTRGRLLLLNEYEPSLKSTSLNELKNKLRTEINRSLEYHVQVHNQAVKDWHQKLTENPSKDKNRGPRKNFRLYKTINELIIRCIDRQLETITMLDSNSLELFLADQIVPLWEQSGWMTAKKIINEVIRIEYRPLRDPNSSSQAPRVTSVSPVAERTSKELQLLPPPLPPPPKISNPISSPTGTISKPPPPPPQQQQQHQQQHFKTNDIKPSHHSSTHQSQRKSLETATRVTPNPVKQHTSRPSSTEPTLTKLPEQSTNKTMKTEPIRPVVTSALTLPLSQSDSTVKRNSLPSSTPSPVIDLTMDLFSQYKKQITESAMATSKTSAHSSSSKDLSSSQRPSSSPSSSSSSSSVNSAKQQQQQFATKLPSEKNVAGSYLKDALLTGASSPKISASPLAVDSMLSKPASSPKTNANISSMKPPPPPTTLTSPIHHSPRPSGSNKSGTNRPSTDHTHHRTDQQSQHSKTPSSSSRSQPTTPLSSSVSPSSRRPTSGLSSNHEQKSSRSHVSQDAMQSVLPQSLQWDQATLQLAAALANPQLLNSSVFDSTLFNSVFGPASNMIPSNPPSSSRQSHSQNPNPNRRT